MSSTRILGTAAAVSLLLASGSATARDIKPAKVGKQLAGEWSGQIQMRSADEQLSTSMVSMSAVKDDRQSTLELYYEGFAFGESVEGAMILSFDRDMPSLSVREEGARQASVYYPAQNADPSQNAMIMSNDAEDGNDARAVFSRMNHDAWDIELQERSEDGSWVSTLVLRLDRLDEGQRSAAAERFSRAEPLLALRRDRAIASVPTD